MYTELDSRTVLAVSKDRYVTRILSRGEPVFLRRRSRRHWLCVPCFFTSITALFLLAIQRHLARLVFFLSSGALYFIARFTLCTDICVPALHQQSFFFSISSSATFGELGSVLSPTHISLSSFSVLLSSLRVLFADRDRLGFCVIVLTKHVFTIITLSL